MVDSLEIVWKLDCFIQQLIQADIKENLKAHNFSVWANHRLPVTSGFLSWRDGYVENVFMHGMTAS